MDPLVARKTWRTLEPLHGLIYFTPHADRLYAALGIQGNRMGYFASRAAPMGPVAAEVVIATFFNFWPELVRRSIPAAWAIAQPSEIVDARIRAADLALRDVLGDAIDSAAVREAATLARTAAEAAAEHPAGRALFAATAALEWPDDPHLVLWHAQTLLREFRGDAHVAALVMHGLSPIEALVSHAASGDVPAATLQSSRSWPDDQWRAAVGSMSDRGLVEVSADGSITATESGRAHRDSIERATDEASVVAYEAIGEDGCERLRGLARPMSRAVVDGGHLAP